MTTQNEDFVTGELYLFHTSDADCPRETSLWGVTGPYRKSALNALASFSSLNSGHNL